jgi:hypothetical protein
MRNWLQKTSERTLYHGTCRAHEESIREFGVIPQVGAFVGEGYAEYLDAGIELPEIVFATDKQRIDKATTAMINCIAVSLGKNFHDINNDDVLKHGAIVVFKGSEGSGKPEDTGLQYMPDDSMDAELLRNDYPQVEPGDYFTEGNLNPDIILTGSSLVRFLKRVGRWPIELNAEYQREQLIRAAIKAHPERTKQEIIQHIDSLTGTQFKNSYETYVVGRYNI